MIPKKLALALIIVINLSVVQQAFPFCFEEAAQEYNLSPDLLYSIGKHESGLNPAAVNWNTNGTYDLGPMQINSSWAPTLAKAGIPWSSLANPCTNVKVGAWILAQCFEKYGQTWQAVGCYHSRTPSKRDKYARQIAHVYKNLGSQRKQVAIETDTPMFTPTPKVVWNDKATLWSSN